MSTLKIDLDLDLPTDIPDLPPPWPPTGRGIEWWMNRRGWFPPSPPFEERLHAQLARAHYGEPFVSWTDGMRALVPRLRAACWQTTRHPRMKTLFLTNEYPPTIYGGAGVHVDYLCRELAKLMEVEVRCYGKEMREVADRYAGAEGDRLRARHRRLHRAEAAPLRLRRGAARARLEHDEHRCRRRASAHVVHASRRHHGEAELRHPDGAHGAFARAAAPVEARATRRRLRLFLLGGKDRDRNGGRRHRRVAGDEGGYAAASSMCRRSASTSSTTASTSTNTSRSRRPGRWRNTASIRACPYVLFVGRITRQKGIVHLVRAIQHHGPGLSGRALRRRAGHAGDRGGNEGGRRRGAGEARRA